MLNRFLHSPENDTITRSHTSITNSTYKRRLNYHFFFFSISFLLLNFFSFSSYSSLFFSSFHNPIAVHFIPFHSLFPIIFSLYNLTIFLLFLYLWLSFSGTLNAQMVWLLFSSKKTFRQSKVTSQAAMLLLLLPFWTKVRSGFLSYTCNTSSSSLF